MRSNQIADYSGSDQSRAAVDGPSVKMLLVTRGGLLEQEEFVAEFEVGRSSCKHDRSVFFDSGVRGVVVRAGLDSPPGSKTVGCEQAAYGVWK